MGVKYINWIYANLYKTQSFFALILFLFYLRREGTKPSLTPIAIRVILMWVLYPLNLRYCSYIGDQFIWLTMPYCYTPSRANKFCFFIDLERKIKKLYCFFVFFYLHTNSYKNLHSRCYFRCSKKKRGKFIYWYVVKAWANL